jgi:beta-phosphoglucomutase-like phosphatase (HAD superfamily)
MIPLDVHRNCRIELIIFDCDGVPIDSEMIAATALSAALAEDGVHLPPSELARRFVGISDKDTLAALRAEHTGITLHCESRYRELAQARFDAELVAIEGIRDVLRALESSGVQCCVASSSSLDRLHLTLGKVGLLPYFGGKVFSSSQVLHPWPYNYERPNMALGSTASEERLAMAA